MASSDDRQNSRTGLTVEKLKEVMKNVEIFDVRKFPGGKKPSRVQPIGGMVSPLFLHTSDPPDNPFDEVYQDLYLGDLNLAHDKAKLQEVGITYIVNAAQGPKFNQINTNTDYYADVGIRFLGINAIDTPRFQMQKHYHTAADFMEEAFENAGKVYIHCQHGLSRSSTLVLAFLMLKRSMTLEEAAILVRQKRPIMPNDGFLQQLINFDNELQCLRNLCMDASKVCDSIDSPSLTSEKEFCENCDKDRVMDEISDQLESLNPVVRDEMTNSHNCGENEQMNGADTKAGDATLTLDEVKKFMRFACPNDSNEKSKKKKKKQKTGTVLYVQKGNISSPAFVNDFDEVFPGLCIGNHKIARDLRGLKALDITHILNTAHGPGAMQVDIDQDSYKLKGIQFCGIPAKDIAAYKLHKHFDDAADFIADAVSNRGKVLVHCHQGRSRSAAIVLAYLMMREKMTLLEAIKTVRQKRWIWPNDGFLNQLIDLNTQLFCK